MWLKHSKSILIRSFHIWDVLEQRSPHSPVLIGWWKEYVDSYWLILSLARFFFSLLMLHYEGAWCSIHIAHVAGAVLMMSWRRVNSWYWCWFSIKLYPSVRDMNFSAWKHTYNGFRTLAQEHQSSLKIKKFLKLNIRSHIYKLCDFDIYHVKLV